MEESGITNRKVLICNALVSSCRHLRCMDCQGCENGVFGKLCFCPSPAENWWFRREVARMAILQSSTHKTRGCAPQIPKTNPNDEDGGCRSRTPPFAENQGGKKNPNPNFLVRIFSSGVGVFHVNGWGPKSSIRPSKPGKSNFLGGISRDFAGISWRCPKSLRKKSLCSISVP